MLLISYLLHSTLQMKHHKGRIIRKGGGGVGKLRNKIHASKPRCQEKKFLQAETKEKKNIAEGI